MSKHKQREGEEEEVSEDKERALILRKIFEGDRIGARRRILKSILETPEKRSFYSELSRKTGISRRAVLNHLAYLVDNDVLTYSYEPVPVGEQQRLVMVKWYSLRKGLEWLQKVL